ncbi:methyltransferase domain-containing protein [Anoxybacterium hadale]|uniref:Methyltransferase domain-containing protein n=1 Tax=Anoxybacterium hadale TaxID=3408580 RepID=A0ACD1AHH6_9FIRM|nr:methyltransferase domain-containing protein [Clostridiales bacterium]
MSPRGSSSTSFLFKSCEQVPYPDNTFDAITVCAAYHHFPDVKNFAKEAYRVLKQDATIYIAEVYYPTVIRVACNPFLPLLKEGDVKFYSPHEIITTIKGAGFIDQSYRINGHIQIVRACK